MINNSEDTPFQSTVVGQSTIPAIKSRNKYLYLKDMLANLGEGQAIRCILPKGLSPVPMANYWYKICGKGKGSYRKKVQADGSHIIWLWFNKGLKT